MTTAPADIPHGTYLVCSGAYPEKGRRWRCPKQPPQPSASVPTGSLQVRLVGSSGRCAGHVEVYSGGSWSWVCQEGWELQDAAVVCRELGCGTALQAPGWARSGAGTGPLWPYSPECSGPEESLWECGRTERRECGRGGGAGAVCSGQCRAAPDQGPAEAPGGSWPCRDPPAPLAEQLSVRLAGGPGRCRGFLEISYNGTWGRVCANGSSPSTAATVCRQLGCGHRGWLLPVPAQEPTEAWLAWVARSPGWLRRCPGCAPGAPRCQHWGHLRGSGSGELRLVGGGGRCAGRVEVKHDGEWGSVCVFDFDWEARWAVVVCRQLGCGRVARASLHAPFGQGSGRIWLQPFFCVGTEDALEHCPHFGWGQHFCGHEWDVGVTCTGEGTRWPLAGGGSPCAGRVEVKLQGHWGSVADDGWDMEDAEVVCQQLGCGSASAAYIAPSMISTLPLSVKVGAGPGGLRLFMPIPCRWPCTAPTGFSQLVGGDGACAGRLEVRQGRAWVGVCEDEVDMEAAQVVCRELGCGEVIAIPGSGRFGAVSGSLWDGGFQCNGTEPLLSACARRAPQRQGCSGPGSVICSCKWRGQRGQLGSPQHQCSQGCSCRSLHGLPAGERQLGMLGASGGGSEGDVGLRVRQRVGPARCARPVPARGLRARLQRAPGRLLRQRGGAAAAGRLRLQRERAAPGPVPRGRAGEAALCPRKRRRRQLLRWVWQLCEEP
uniref:Uncharacterized protein n=1 Tax=Geospiza parvula TaxID=87175 RepID=A0A8C3M548_GEOPR